ncbi:hypothetical protein, partial [Hominenteromicrobium sp.]|uniref:hypothetical protein n=1 Tax=Hominenteromicrobium sp. TaxID=3073581 RepID=UPI003AF7CA6B
LSAKLFVEKEKHILHLSAKRRTKSLIKLSSRKFTDSQGSALSRRPQTTKYFCVRENKER